MKTNKPSHDPVQRAVRRALRTLDARRHAQQGVAVALLALAALSIGGCGSEPTAPSDADAASKLAGKAKAAPKPQRLEAGRQPSAAAAPADPTTALMNPGDEVDGNVGADRLPSRVRARAGGVVTPPASQPAEPSAQDIAAARRLAASRGARGAAATTTADIDDEKPTWAVLLASFTGEDHRANAASARDQIARRYPALKDCYVRTTTRGSVVLIGRFDGTKDPAAQAELKRVKEIQQDGQRVFGRAMLTRMGANPDLSPPGPHDLRTVRAQAPGKVLYTLQVAAWIGSDGTTQEIKMSEIKRSAEAYCAQLRAAGDEAYYFHDFDTKTSVVTIGVFGPDAYDSKSTLYAPEVEAVMRKYPKQLVNGAELLLPVDPKNLSGKTRPQPPMLVEVPKI